MAKLAEIRELSSELARKKTELSHKKAHLFAQNDLRGVKSAEYETQVGAIVQLLKEIAKISQQISIKYLSLATETTNRFEEEQIIETASKFAKISYEANAELKDYEARSN